MNDLVPEYEGMDLYEAREKIVEKLKEIGALVKIEDYTHNVGKCYRCNYFGLIFLKQISIYFLIINDN